MAIGAASGQGRQARFAFGALIRTLTYRFHGSLLYRWRYAGSVPERLLIAPIDLRTADPTNAQDIYSGRFVFGGEGVDIDGFSVFEVEAPHDDWARTLHGFTWLRHLRASDSGVARSHARTLVDEWIRLSGRHDALAWEPDVVARRVIAWLSQSPIILEGCDLDFYRRFMRSITRQVRYLRRTAYDGTPGLPRLGVMVALASAALSMSDQPRFLRQATRLLDLELVRQVLPDGGHVSRNPGAVLDILVDLLPLRQAFAARGGQPSRILLSAIDRMMPMLRFFRQGDGGFAHFNGQGDTASDLLATVLAYDDARGQPLAAAPHSGYQRIDASSTVLLIDAGRPPTVNFSINAHAGCLSFEMSVGRQRLFINCGVPGPASGSMRRLARTTAAHTTATINDTSSCRFLARTLIGDWLGEAIAAGPSRVEAERFAESGATALEMSHDGYVDRFGIVHERRLSLSSEGDRLDGLDTFTTPRGGSVNRSGKDNFAIRFHLHPNVRAEPHDNGSIVMQLPDGETWEFETDAPEVLLEESIMFTGARGGRPTEQIVIHGRVQSQQSIAWQVHRTALGGRRARLPSR